MGFKHPNGAGVGGRRLGLRALNVTLINERALLDCRVKQKELVSFILTENRNIIFLANLKNSQSAYR